MRYGLTWYAHPHNNPSALLPSLQTNTLLLQSGLAHDHAILVPWCQCPTCARLKSATFDYNQVTRILNAVKHHVIIFVSLRTTTI